MELKFEKEMLSFLDLTAWENQSQELTQELRLTEDMPDAGRVLGCWGQCILRSKEWRTGGMTASGGVMAWVLYAPEEGSAPRCVEAWIPYQLKWSFPPGEKEGLMSVACSVRSADARVVSARKLMLRVSVGGLGIAVCPTEVEIPKAGEVPEDVNLLEKAYPMTLPVEAGEKTLQLDEDLELSRVGQEGGKLLRCLVQPRIQEQRIVGDRLVFRGNARVMVLTDKEGSLRQETLEVPFSTFTDLDREYVEDPSAQIEIALTSLETEMTPEGHLRLKVGMTAQYIIWERKMLTVVEDAYSARRDIRLQEQIRMLPALLEHRSEVCSVSGVVHQGGGQIVDAVCCGEPPVMERQDEVLRLRVQGNAQMICQASGGFLGVNQSLEGTLSFTQDESSRCLVAVKDTGSVQASSAGEDMELRSEVALDIRFLSGQGIEMVTAMELGELRPEDPDRPSLVLRRAAGESLWELAKASGSTVDAICRANQIEQAPEPGYMLLIPVQ